MRRGGGTKRERERKTHREDKREGTGRDQDAGEDRQTENHEHSIRKKKKIRAGIMPRSLMA